ncbi:nucleoside triphosphate pyrophosphatase [Wenzhouxiangella sp. XN24]|uniref:Maf family protein n=1 Tax=Wenzhouxiangella sp. XN24 TaxID=2713569 RepID=UPI0013ECDD9C|nr:nucleoside triphosphate pyrophosphatase [Wenzhouxiangella sp. XN24]NGX16710.1 septum formation protein Maf [Wenzhouxiangella sp. XN24]
MNQVSSHQPPVPELLLASASRYRRALLERLGVPFTQVAPDIDETIGPDETPADAVLRLARSKAQAVLAGHPDAIVIASDQVALRGDEILGKPGNAEQAIRQLSLSAGRQVEFLTGVCVIRGDRPNDPAEHMDITRVVFRPLAPEEIRDYVERDAPFDCAGSFRAEGLGIALFERIDSQDPTGLIGLPLIWLAQALRRLGVPVL